MKEVPHKIDRYLTRRDAIKAGVGFAGMMAGSVSAFLGGGAFGLSFVEMSPEMLAAKLAKGKTEEEVRQQDLHTRRKARKRGGVAFLLGTPSLLVGKKISDEADRAREEFGFDDFVAFVRNQDVSTIEVAAKTTENYGRSPELLRFGTTGFGSPNMVPEFSGYLMETVMIARDDTVKSLSYTQSNKYQYAETRLKGDQYTDFLYELELRNLLTAHERAGLLRNQLPGVEVNVLLQEGVSEEQQSLRLEDALHRGLEPFPMYLPETGSR